MRLRTPPKNKREANLVPLINVVFLLLVFFIVAGNLRPFKERDVKPAEASSARGDRPVNPVMIDKKGIIIVSDRIVSLELLKKYLLRVAPKYEKKPLFIVADQNLPAKNLVDIIEAAKAAKISKIRLVTRRKQGK